jgi:hypothetical protein
MTSVQADTLGLTSRNRIFENLLDSGDERKARDKSIAQNTEA